MFSACGVGVEPRTPQNLIRIGSRPHESCFPGLYPWYLPMMGRASQLPDWFTAQYFAAIPRLFNVSPIMNREARKSAGPHFRMVNPNFKEFSRLAVNATLVPVVKSVTADLLTPVSAFLAIADKEPDAFLLESVERGEQIGRYTFLGARPYMQVRAESGNVVVQRGKQKENRQGSAIQVIKELLRQHRPAIVPGLPPFTAGAVGYFSYDAVRQLE